MSATLFTVGYLSSEDVTRLEILLQAHPQALLIDTRLVPRSRWRPQWNRKQLEARYGDQYRYGGQWLGNRHYKRSDLPIVLADADQGIPWLIGLLAQGYILILLCACADYKHCHRKVIFERVQSLLQQQETA